MTTPRTKTLPTSTDQILAAPAATLYLEWCGAESFMLVPEAPQQHLQDPTEVEATVRPGINSANLNPQGAKPGG